MTPQEFCVAAMERARRVLVEADEPFRLLLAAFLVEGHVLVEGVPGTAKTLMARTLAQLVTGDDASGAEGDGPTGGQGLPGESRGRGRFQRIQFTPDLMP